MSRYLTERRNIRMADFFNSAFPWVIMGLAVAIVCTYDHTKKKKKQNNKDEK